MRYRLLILCCKVKLCEFSKSSQTQAMYETVMYLSVLVFAGVVAGFLAGLFGIGGGLVFVPVLFFLFLGSGMQEGAAISLAVGSSLATIIFSASSSALAHHRLQNIEFRVVKLWLLPMLLAVILASQLIHPEFGVILVMVFVCLLIVVALNFYFNFLGELPEFLAQSKPLQITIAFFIGGFSVLAGVGGGTLSVAALVASGLSAHRAVGTSALMGLVIALPAVAVLLLQSETPANAPPFTYGLINYLALVVLALGAMSLAPFGARFGKRLPERTLKRLFACCMLLVAVSMLWRAL